MMKFIFLFFFPFVIALFIDADKKTFSNPEDPFADGRIQYCAPGFDTARAGKGPAPLIEGLGNVHFKISSRSKKVQKYFDQGLALAFGFNHAEAARSFKEVIRLEPELGIAYWGLAFVLGPNYNAVLDPAVLDQINEALANAAKYSSKASPVEQTLIHALSLRFPRSPVDDIAPYSEAYAAAMRKAYEQFPENSHVGTLLADALMNMHPWDLWEKNGNARPWTPEIVRLLEEVMEKDPAHPGALHAYIHTMEASPYADKAIPAADRLRNLMPAAGHLVHMPSHIYIRTGFYHKGVIANELASVADSTYIAQCNVQGVYPLLYYPHNIHFLAACAFLEGNSKKAIEAAWAVSSKADREYLDKSATVQHYWIIPYYMLVQLGEWNEIENLLRPPSDLKYPLAIWHYARGMAFNAKGKKAKALEELKAVKKIAADPVLSNHRIWDMNSAADLVKIAELVLEAEIIAGEKHYEKAIDLLKQATSIEDALNYTEPPDWFFSVRHTLGHVLNKAGKFAEAEKVYREDLVNLPENGWSLIGLYNSLEGQGKKPEADAVKQRFNNAWQWADISIASSRKY